MAEIHLLNVDCGDCTIMQHNSGRVTMVDICCGNLETEPAFTFEESAKFFRQTAVLKANYGMCKKPTNPIAFLTKSMGITQVFRFILTHPDMDHLDGFNRLMDDCSVLNFWDNGIRRDKPEFDNARYQEADWDRYIKVRDDKEEGVTVVTPKAGSKGKYYNENGDGSTGGDYIYIYAPSKTLIDEANENGDVNDASYVVCYRSSGGRILICGDAHNKTMQYVLDNYLSHLEDCEFMLAPHHGRDSDRDFTFLDKIKPKFTLFGCASSSDLAYEQWNRRKLEKITQNQAGNFAIYPDNDGLDIYVENEKFAADYGGNVNVKDRFGNSFLKTVPKSANY